MIGGAPFSRLLGRAKPHPACLDCAEAGAACETCRLVWFIDAYRQRTGREIPTKAYRGILRRLQHVGAGWDELLAGDGGIPPRDPG